MVVTHRQTDHPSVRPVTVIIPFTDETGYKEVYSPGFLTSERHAMYIEDDRPEVVFVGVIPSRDPEAYIGVTRYLSLGNITGPDHAELVAALTTRLQEMSAYEFLADVILFMRDDQEFGKLIIPGILM